MNCHEARALFSAKAADLLLPGQRSALDAHLAACADCSREWGRFRQTIGLLRSVKEAHAPAGFARRVAARREPWHRRLGRAVFLPLRVKLPLEAAALVLGSVLVVFLYRQTSEVRRAVEAPASPAVTAAAPEPPAKAAQASGRLEYAHAGKGRPTDEEETSREARTSAPPAAEPKLAIRAQGPFHLVGLLRPSNRDALDSQLGHLVKQVGGILVRDADRVGPGSIVEVVLPREAYPRLEAGLRQLGDFTVETRAWTFPDRLRIALRIAD